MDPYHGRVLHWCENKAECAAVRKEIRKRGNTAYAEFAHNIPTDKKGLCAWLNNWVTNDNG
jgi:hypothetical protein